MINSIVIKNFKLYKEYTTIPLSKINLFTGINGKGKSTVLQVFLILSQSALKNRSTHKITLNGSNVKLGSMDDVKNRKTSLDESIDFTFFYDNFEIHYNLSQQLADASEIDIEEIDVKGSNNGKNFQFFLKKNQDHYLVKHYPPAPEKKEFPTTLFDLFIDNNALTLGNEECEMVKKSLNLNYVHYVSADRSGPKNYYESETLGHFVSVGALGENTVNVLHHKGADMIDPTLFKKFCRFSDLREDETGKTIEDHVIFWMEKIFQGAKVKVEPIKDVELLKLRISSESDTPYFKPTNVGYGFSYSLPIIVAGLVAKPGEILIIENPEAHLHPYAQSILAKFLSLVGASGVQVFIESHSEHILNGLRISLFDNQIEQGDLNILYFGQDDTKQSYFQKIDVEDDGSIKKWPNNFFDQATKDLNHLFGI